MRCQDCKKKEATHKGKVHKFFRDKTIYVCDECAKFGWNYHGYHYLERLEEDKDG